MLKQSSSNSTRRPPGLLGAGRCANHLRKWSACNGPYTHIIKHIPGRSGTTRDGKGRFTDKVVWDKKYEGGCDRMALSPDGKIMYVPSLEKDFWNVVNPMTGEIIKRIDVVASAHNTIYSGDGKHV